MKKTLFAALLAAGFALPASANTICQGYVTLDTGIADVKCPNMSPSAVVVVSVSVPDLDIPPGTVFVDPATIVLTDRRHQGGFSVQDTGGSNSVIAYIVDDGIN
jgi:hypothetical protein